MHLLRESCELMLILFNSWDKQNEHPLHLCLYMYIRLWDGGDDYFYLYFLSNFFLLWIITILSEDWDDAHALFSLRILILIIECKF